MFGYHFTAKTLRDGRAIPSIDEWLEHTGKIEPCESGLHMSEHPFDALAYAPGNLLHRVELEGDIAAHGNPVDKYVGRRRRIIASVDAEKTLRVFACQCALDVIHLWDAPAIVREYLETRGETKRDAAWDAAWAAARAADNAAWAAPRAAAGGAARAADNAAWGAAWDAAWAAAGAADNAAWDAARVAAAAADAADAAWAAARAAQRARFQQMVDELFKRTKDAPK